MSIKAINWAIMQEGLAPSPKLVLIVLANRANEQFKAWPSIETICRESGLSNRTARRALCELEKASLIEHSGFSFRAKCYLLKVPSGFKMTVETADLTGQIDHVTGHGDNITGHHDLQTIRNHQRNHQEPELAANASASTIDTAWRPLVRQVQDAAGYDLARLMPNAADGGEVRQWLADITAKGHSVQSASEIVLMAINGVMERRREQGPPKTLRYFRNAVAEMAAATPTREAARMEAAFLEHTKVEMRHKRRPKSWTAFQQEWSSVA